MGKDCDWGNDWLDAKALAVYHVAKGEGGGLENSSRLFGLRISIEMPWIWENRSLNKETLHMVIHHLIMHRVRTGQLKTLEFQESNFKALKVLEFRLRSLKVLDFLLNKIEKYLLLQV